MLKAVLDTNVLVSALIVKNGKPAQIIEFARRNKFVLLHLLQLLGRMTSPQLAIEFLKGHPRPAPVVIRPVGEDEFLHVMMPLVEARASPKEKREQKEPAQTTPPAGA